MPSNKTIVFGPTGYVGSATAHTAHDRGAEVVLAMRDPSKPIRGLLSPELPAGFKKIQADLADPSSVHTVVTTTGAKHAFIYLVFGSPDSMRSTIEALKSGGIDFVVFLSSAWITASTADELKRIHQVILYPSHMHKWSLIFLTSLDRKDMWRLGRLISRLMLFDGKG
jgi:NAD(P)-dependent dehydrogenase (short-subunit alcohol dehydrogenase family)